MSSNEEIRAALQDGVDITGRRIFLHGEINEERVSTAIRGLYLLANKKAPIELYVSSEGGDLDDMFVLHDVTRTVPAPVHTVALGKCMSSAVLLVACGEKGSRYASENTQFMLHGALISIAEESSRPHVQTVLQSTKARMDAYAVLMARYTNKSVAHWNRLLRGPDKFFDAEAALEWGIVDHIWSEK